MQRLVLLLVVSVLLVTGLAGDSTAGEFDLAGWTAVEGRYFPLEPLFPSQPSTNLSYVLRPEFYFGWKRGNQSINVIPFMRIDQHDSYRSHFDIREALYLYVGGRWELRAGIGTVFWGVTESQHLVDIINQTDLVEDPDGEEKLGQPMIDLTILQNWGTVDLFLLFGFRDRLFPGPMGRFRPTFPLGTPIYESSGGKEHIDWALRWSHSFYVWDVGLSYFNGTSRDPRFLLDTSTGGIPFLVPVYEQIQQVGLEAQATTGGWLWKLETIARTGQGPDFLAITGGFEYTFIGLFGGRSDIGVLTEYLYDSRKDPALNPFENDIFAGARFVFNDVQSMELLAGAIIDQETTETLLRVEGSRRIGDRWRLSLDYRGVTRTERGDPFFGLRQDGFLQLELALFF